MSAHTPASQSLDEFLADVPSITPASAGLQQLPTEAELSASILEAYTFLWDNSRDLQNCVAASQPFLPVHEHRDL